MDYRTTLIDSREGVNLTVQVSLSDRYKPSGTRHFRKNALQLYRKRCFPRDCGDHCHGFAEAGITQTAEEKGKNL